jgi:hypothetical protein
VEIVCEITSAKAGAIASWRSLQFSFRNAFTWLPETEDHSVLASAAVRYWKGFILCHSENKWIKYIYCLATLCQCFKLYCDVLRH